MVIGVLILAAAYAGFEYLRSDVWPDPEVWSVRLGITTSVLLLLNLIALWRYTQLTGDAVDASRLQAAISAGQLELAQKEFAATQEHFAGTVRPCVVIERMVGNPSLREQPAGGGWGYYARNIGPGPALNVVYARLGLDDKIDHVQGLGSLGSGERVLIGPKAHDLIAGSTAGDVHVMLADGLQRGAWVRSLNEIDGSEQLRHRADVLTALTPAQEEAMRQPLTPTQKLIEDFLRDRHRTG